MAVDLTRPLCALSGAVLFATTALIPSSAARAQPAPAAPLPSRLDAGTLEVPLHKSKVVSVDRPIAKALIGSDEIADVLPLTDRSIYVLGKKMGTTSLTLYDATGRVLSVMNVGVGPDVDALKGQFRTMIPDEPINASISNDSIILSGLVSSADAASRAVLLAKTYAGDKVVNMISVGGSQQVMLEVRFAEVSRNVGKDIGFSHTVTSRNGAFSSVAGKGSSVVGGGTVTDSRGTSNNSASVTTGQGLSGTTGPITGSVGDFTNLGTLAGRTFSGNGYAQTDGSTSSGSAAGAVGSVTTALGGAVASTLVTTTNTLGNLLQLGTVNNSFGIFQQRFSIGGLTLQSMLNAMETRGQAKTLAQPTLLALSGEKASFLAGGEFPIPVAQSGNGNGVNAITVEFKQFGVSLAFTPTVLGDKTINLIVEPEVSQIDPAASIVLNGISIPGLRTRRASTTLELRDGESFAIAGLLSKDLQTSVSQIPFLGSLPILGALFRSTNFQRGETELLIVVTPHLVAPLRPGQVVLPTDRVRDPKDAELFLLGKDYNPQKVGKAPGEAVGVPPAAAETATATKGDGYAY